MNILHVVDMISQQRAGGSAKVPFQLGEAQARLGHKVTIFSSDYNAEKQQPPKGVELVKFKCWVNLLGGVRITPDMWHADFKKFDIVHLHNYRTFVNIIAANKNVPCVLQAHGSCQPIKSLANPIHNFTWRNLIFQRASGYIADAELEIEQYMAEGATRESIFNIPVGIDYKEFRNLPKRSTDGKKRVLFLGRFHENKGPDLLAKAFALLKRDDVTLQLAGYDDGYEVNLTQQVKDIGIESKVEYLGPRYGKDKVNAYTNADVYVMPSRRELFGLTLLEALACGTPVIITDRCGVAPLLPSECGMVVPFDEYALAEAINKALDKDIANSYREYRIKWAKQYDWAKLAPQVIRVYEKILGKIGG